MKRILFLTFFSFLFLTFHAQTLDMDYLKAMKARNIGPGGMSGRVTAIDVEVDNPAVFYVGTASGGIWKTTNGGVNFKPIFDDQEVANIGALSLDPSSQDVIWAGTGEGNPRNSLNGGRGIYRSLDGGRSWKLMGLEETRHIHRIIVHPHNSDVIYVGAIGSPWGPHPERGVYRSTDGGESWEQILFVNDLTGVADMVMDPKNPNKLFVAMWEHQRWPWFFKSGGEGSGMFMTVDGGESWTEVEKGLPEGELGRMGLAIAAGNSNYIYALVESKKNAIYRSTDGGYTWEERGSKNMGGRPFYYADIFVDPANENRLYSLHSTVSVSEDGGKSFSTLIDYNIHLDHHAWWIHPNDPSFMIDGNDGGLAITRDRGQSWRHVSNLPVSQFYHISVDMELPYNVYGGMQDNGSWKGPAYKWSGGGIINTYWDFLMGGDGFDVVSVPGDPGYCYAMSQQGNIRRVDLETGRTVDIKPAANDDETLRFHWNSALAQDPFHNDVIYFGSQFVHRSEDRGDSWVKISPDLTTNDTAKQKFNESGGLTYDVTGAETHTCILAIAPSPVEEGVLWVGSDDGNVQISTDGGENWTNCSPRISELPKGSWVPQIVPSSSVGGEAFVVVNNYRQNDYAPYLFHTKDYGKKWSRLIDQSDVPGYVLSFAQDPKEAGLLFLGTEYGLYLSIDGGEEWTRWTNGYPTVSTMDLVIHPREQDLVIGTFGRSAFILDDIRPLRAMAKDYNALISEKIYPVESAEAYLAAYRNAPGYYFTGDAYFEGENRSYGARINYFMNVDTTEENGKKDSVLIEILDAENKLVRTLKSVPENGLNRTNWRLDRKGVRVSFTKEKPKSRGNEPGGGGSVIPGSYGVRISYQGDTVLSSVDVKADPRIPYDMAGMLAKQEKADELLAKMEALNSSLSIIRDCREGFTLIGKLASKEQAEKLRDLSEPMEVQLKILEKEFFRDENIQGIYSPSDALYAKFSGTYGILGSSSALTENQLDKFAMLMGLADETIERVSAFMEEEWSVYKEAVQKEEISLLK